MRALQKRIEDDPATAVHEPHAQLDVLDRGAGKASFVKAADRQERVATHRAEPRPERSRGACGALVHVVVEKIPKLRDDPSGSRIIIV
jgi:hypothetical protein